jgi:MoaA/NifB/PqqE/SkfB family radical SAM enzyme
MGKSISRQIILNKSLIVFFTNALRITVKNPLQAYSFLRTLLWLGKAARLRSKWKKQGFVIPPIIIFSITNRCDLKCKGCYAQLFHPSSEEELSDEKLRIITEEAKELGVSFFVIAGGEPLMRPVMLNIMKDFPEIIFLVFTNGLLINDKSIITFKKHKNIIPLISLEGNEEDTDSRRGKGTFEKLQNTMALMKEKDIFFGNSLTLTSQNFDLVMDEHFIIKLVDGGCKFFLFLEYTPIEERTEDWVLNEHQRGRMITLLQKYRAKYPALFIGVPWDEQDVGGCLSAGRGFVHINASGDIEPCPFAPFSDTNLRDSSLKEALQSEFLSTIRQIPELAVENGGGCVLWKERKLVQSLLENSAVKNNSKT